MATATTSPVLNASDGSLAGTIDLGGGPEFAVSDGKGNLYVNLEEKNETLHVDVNAMKVKDRWPLAPCATPTSIAMDVANRRLFVGCRSRHFAVLNADNGKIVFTAPIGERVDAGAFDAKTRLVYLSTGDGKVFVFHQDSPDQYSLSQEITTLKGAKTSGLRSQNAQRYRADQRQRRHVGFRFLAAAVITFGGVLGEQCYAVPIMQALTVCSRLHARKRHA